MYTALIVACELHDCTVVSTWQFNTNAGAAVTVNDELAVTFPSQLLVAVHVTVTEPPHAEGTDAGASFVTFKLHPPLDVTPDNHVAYAALIVDCVWHDTSIAFVGAVNTTAGAVILIV